MKCEECEIEYPEEVLLNPLITSDGNTGFVCGICALEISNQYHGIERDSFQGEVAEQARQDALAYRQEKGINRK